MTIYCNVHILGMTTYSKVDTGDAIHNDKDVSICQFLEAKVKAG